MVCSTIGCPCPKVADDLNEERLTDIVPFRVPPVCIYLFPHVAPSIAIPSVAAQPIDKVELLSAFHRCFKGNEAEQNHVDFEVLRNHPAWLSITHIVGP